MAKILFGIAIGFISGFFGGGGGMIAVPVLTAVFLLDQKSAHASAILVILPVTIFATAVYFFKVGYDPITLIAVSAGVLAGGVVGAKLLDKLPQNVIWVAFVLLMAASGAKLAFA